MHIIDITLQVIGLLTVIGAAMALFEKAVRIVRRYRSRAQLIARCEAMKRSPGWTAYWLGKGPQP